MPKYKCSECNNEKTAREGYKAPECCGEIMEEKKEGHDCDCC